MWHKVKIIETVSKIEYVEAATEEEAMEIAAQLYNNGEVDLEKEIDLETHMEYVGVSEEETED